MENENSKGYCGCSSINNDSEKKIDIKNLTDCPHCGMRFDTNQELFYHFLIFHSG